MLAADCSQRAADCYARLNAENSSMDKANKFPSLGQKTIKVCATIKPGPVLYNLTLKEVWVKQVWLDEVQVNTK